VTRDLTEEESLMTKVIVHAKRIGLVATAVRGGVPLAAR